MLKIQEFISNHGDWETLLSAPPYSLNIKRKDSRILFKYSQIDSDPSLEIVQEARGLILEDKTYKVISYPFKRFFNYGEPNAATIDWSSATVTSKEDGSLIKVYYYNGWKVGTSGTIDAEDAELSAPPYKNFKQLFDTAAANSNFDFDKLDPHYTYLLELCSPFNKIVVPYNEPKLFHIGTRNNITLEEVEVDIGVEKPRIYKLSSLDDCIAMVATFDFKQEGFVCRDKNYNRIKIKGEDYLKAHRLANNNTINLERAIDLIRTNEIDEFISYFPHYAEYIKESKEKYNNLLNCFKWEKMEAINHLYLSRKDFARLAVKSPLPFIWFNLYDDNNFSIKEFIQNSKTKKIVAWIEKLED